MFYLHLPINYYIIVIIYDIITRQTKSKQQYSDKIVDTINGYRVKI